MQAAKARQTTLLKDLLHFLMTKNAAPATLIANFSGIPLDINLQTWPIPD
jgi:hypothetical protein